MALFFYRLNAAPMFVGGDESLFAIQAHAIATTARDLDGRLFPLFFRVDIHTWYQPMLVYLMALTFTVLHVSEWAMRTPTALIGVVDVLLVYGIGLRLFGQVRYAALAAVMMAMAPTHLLLARQALDYVAPVPFVLGWLWCLLTVLDTGRVSLALAAGLLLGVGFYSYVAAWVLMPTCLGITLVALWYWGHRGRTAAAVATGFLLPLLLLAAWLRLEPGTITTIVARYGMPDATQGAAVWQGIRGLLHYYVIQGRLSLYWDYFDPVYLFLAGSPNVTMSTGKAGVFLVSAAVLLPVGIYEILRRSDRSLILLAGFLLAPLAPVLINTGNAVQRSVVITAFGVLISTYGARRLLAESRPIIRAAAVVLLAAMPIQFAYFAHDYFTAYQFRSANWIDPVNFDVVTRDVVARDAVASVPRIYLSERLDVGEARWRFFLAKYRREDLWARTWIVNPAARTVWSVHARLLPVPLSENAPPPGSVFVMGATDPAVAALTDPGACCAVVRVIPSATGEPATLIIERAPR